MRRSRNADICLIQSSHPIDNANISLTIFTFSQRTHTHTYIQTITFTNAHTHIQTITFTNTHTHTVFLSLTHTHTDTHITHTGIQIRTQARQTIFTLSQLSLCKRSFYKKTYCFLRSSVVQGQSSCIFFINVLNYVTGLFRQPIPYEPCSSFYFFL